MFVITADQVNSRDRADRVAEALRRVAATAGDDLLLPAERTAGDELQAVAEVADAALRMILELHRFGQFSVGCGIGRVDLPLPASAREATGDAFIAARTAVEQAKKRSPRAAVVSAGAGGAASDGAPSSADLQALLDLLLVLREKRSAEGWQLYDLLEAGLTQAQAAEQIGISQQAASKRAIAAHLRADRAARQALARLMGAHQESVTGGD